MFDFYSFIALKVLSIILLIGYIIFGVKMVKKRFATLHLTTKITFTVLYLFFLLLFSYLTLFIVILGLNW